MALTSERVSDQLFAGRRSSGYPSFDSAGAFGGFDASLYNDTLSIVGWGDRIVTLTTGEIGGGTQRGGSRACWLLRRGMRQYADHTLSSFCQVAAHFPVAQKEARQLQAGSAAIRVEKASEKGGCLFGRFRVHFTMQVDPEILAGAGDGRELPARRQPLKQAAQSCLTQRVGGKRLPQETDGGRMIALNPASIAFFAASIVPQETDGGRMIAGGSRTVGKRLQGR